MSVDITIQETVNEVDITVNQNVITVNVTRTTGSGGVESVTGDLVDNTDPSNPIVEVPSLTQVLTVGNISTYTVPIPNNTFVTFDLGRELTENYFTTDDVGTGGVFLDNTVLFPDNATIRFQAGYVQDNPIPTGSTLYPYRFTTDAYVFYQGAIVTDITIQPEDVCTLKWGGNNSTDSIQIWFLTIVSSGGSGTVTSVTGDLVDNTDPLNPVVETPNLAQVLAEDNKTNDIPIVSNNGKAIVDVNDDYTSVGYDTQTFAMTDTEVQLYSEVPVAFDSTVSTDFNTPVLSHNGEEIATQPWVTSQGYGTGTVTSVTGVGGETTVATGTTTPVIGISSAYTSARDAYADAKVADTINNGTTTIAPSQNAVFDALDFTRRLITKGTGSVTGTVSETILTTLTIPANTLDSSCFIWTTMDFFKTNAGVVTIRLYINNANTLTGATLLGFSILGSNRNVSFNRKFLVTGTSLDLLTANTAASQVTNEFIENLYGASTVLTINPSADIFLIYTTQNDATGTVATNKMATVQKMKL